MASADWRLVALLVVVSLPGTLVAVPRTVRGLRERLPETDDPPSYRVLAAVAVVQTAVLVGVAAAVGAVAAPETGLGAPVFEAILSGDPVGPTLLPRLRLAVLAGGVGGAVFLLGYYGPVRRTLDRETLAVMERVRSRAGFAGRLLYGGVTEEVLARWGLVSAFVYAGSRLVGDSSASVVWAGLVVAGVAFGVGHLPSYLGAGCRRTPQFVAATLGLNVWASLVFGWLFWQAGLAAAMVGHALFHMLWWPLDRTLSVDRQTGAGSVDRTE